MQVMAWHRTNLIICPNRSLQWRYNERDGVSNHQRLECLLNLLFRRRSKKTSKLRVTGLCEENSPVTGEFPAKRASNAENVSIWWYHHGWWRGPMIMVFIIKISVLKNTYYQVPLERDPIIHYVPHITVVTEAEYKSEFEHTKDTP